MKFAVVLLAFVSCEEMLNPVSNDGKGTEEVNTDWEGDAGVDSGETIETDENVMESYPCYMGNIHVGEAESLEEIADLHCIEGNLSISYTDDIVKIDLPELSHIYGNLTITYNEVLEDIEIPNLARVDGPLVVTMNEFLPTCEGYNLVGLVRSREGLGAGSLVSGNALDNCTIASECYQWDVIINNQKDMDKFGNLSCIKKTIKVRSNSLITVYFPNLYRAGNILEISDSPNLVYLDIPYLKYVRGIHISNNASLSTCDIINFINQTKSRAPEGDVGYLVVEGNLDDGCTL